MALNWRQHVPHYLFLLHVLFVIATRNRVLATSCPSYTFLSAPVTNILCDPYANATGGEISLECSVKGPKFTKSSSFEIEWNRLLRTTDMEESLTDKADYNPQLLEISTDIVAVPPDHTLVRSTLTLREINDPHIDASGLYWCVVVILKKKNGTQSEIFSDSSNQASLRTPRAYVGLDPCPARIPQINIERTCITIDGMPVTLPTSGSVHLNSSSSSSSGVFTSPTETVPDSDMSSGEGDVVLSQVIVIIMSVIGGLLCIVIHILLVVVGCLFIVSRRKRRRDYSHPHQHVSSSSLLVTPSSGSSRPPTVIKTPKCPPPVPKNKPLRPLQSSLQSSLPPQLIHPPPNLDLVVSQSDEEYAPVQSNHERRQTVIIGDLDTITIASPKTTSFHNLYLEDNKYKSLNRNMMDDQQVYEEPNQSTSLDQDVMDKHVLEPVHNNIRLKHLCDRAKRGIEKNERNGFHKFMKSNLSSQQLLDTRESIDGEYVIPNGVYTGISLPSTEEQPEYIDLTQP